MHRFSQGKEFFGTRVSVCFSPETASQHIEILKLAGNAARGNKKAFPLKQKARKGINLGFFIQYNSL